jgi:glycosyltransferase involved in cell wall biosynthesis
MAKPKILIFSTADIIGGAGRAAYRIHNSIKESGVDSKMIVLNKTSNDTSIIEFLSVFQSKNFAIRQIEKLIKKIKNKYQKAKWNKYPSRENVYMSGMGFFSLSRVLKKFDYDIIHLHWISDGYIDFGKLSNINKPVVWTLHDSFPFTGGCHYFYDCIKYQDNCGSCPFLKSEYENDLTRIIWKGKNKAYKGLKIHVVSPSNWLAECASKSSLFKNFPITVIPNCIDTSIYRPVEKKLARNLFDLSAGIKYILIGAMNIISDINKGFHLFKKTLEFLERRSEFDIEILVLGSEKRNVDYLYGFKIHYLGLLFDDLSLTCLYNAADVTLVTSLSENLSCTIMESLSCGTPIVAFNIGGNQDLVDSMKNGYLAEPYLPEDLARGIIWCLKNNKSQRLSVNARNKVLYSFSKEIIAMKYIDFYNSICNK